MCWERGLTVVALPMPNYAYVPGRNQRHHENAFDAIRATAELGHNVAELSTCDAFQAGLQFFEAGYFWETHEVLEPVWIALPEGSVEKQFVQGLIQLANGRLKLRMDRPKAALRLVGQARGLIPTNASATVMAVRVMEVHRWIDALEGDILLAL